MIWIIAVIVTRLVDTRLLQAPKQIPDIRIGYWFIQTIPSRYVYDGPFTLTYDQQDELYGIQIRVRSVGDVEAKNFEMDLHVLEEATIVPQPVVIYIPSVLANRVVDSLNLPNRLYRKLEIFPCGTEIFVQINTSSPVSEDNILLEFMSDLRQWNAEPKGIEIKRPTQDKHGSIMGLLSILCAEELVVDTEETLDPMTIREMPEIMYSLKENRHRDDFYETMFYVDGYDTGNILYWLYVMLAHNNILDSIYMQRIAEESMAGVDAGYCVLDVLKELEITLDLLIRKNIMSFDEANSIIDDSRNAGGTLIGGYNTLVLLVRILDKMYERGYITLSQGQAIIESSRLKGPFEKSQQ